MADWALGLADVGLTVDDLALEVGLVDLVELGDPDRAHARGGHVEQRRAAETARADDEHLGVLQPLLPGHAHVRDDQVAAVAADLVDGQLVSGLDQRGKLTGDTPHRDRCGHRTTRDRRFHVPSGARHCCTTSRHPDQADSRVGSRA